MSNPAYISKRSAPTDEDAATPEMFKAAKEQLRKAGFHPRLTREDILGVNPNGTLGARDCGYGGFRHNPKPASD